MNLLPKRGESRFITPRVKKIPSIGRREGTASYVISKGGVWGGGGGVISSKREGNANSPSGGLIPKKNRTEASVAFAIPHEWLEKKRHKFHASFYRGKKRKKKKREYLPSIIPRIQSRLRHDKKEGQRVLSRHRGEKGKKEGIAERGLDSLRQETKVRKKTTTARILVKEGSRAPYH